jgi:hypothetical protein
MFYGENFRGAVGDALKIPLFLVTNEVCFEENKYVNCLEELLEMIL